MKNEDRVLIAIPLLVMVIVFLLQVYMVKTYQFSTWHLGGFGMFSTADDIGVRRVRAIVVGPKAYELDVADAALEQWERRARVLPTDKVLHEYARKACARAKGVDSKASSVRAEYWETEVDFSDLSVQAMLQKVVAINPC